MDPTVQKLWDEAERTGKPVDIGRLVVCDGCNHNYTDKPTIGGALSGSYAWCEP